MDVSEIPADVMNAARDVFENLPLGHESEAVNVIARALLAERERAAKIAEQWKESAWIDEVFAARSIADAIRS